MDFFYQPASWVFIAFIIFISITIYLKVPNMVTKLLDEQISKIKNELNNYKVYRNPYRLSKKFANIPNEVKKSFLRKDFKLKKCTI